jgi:hypothetical protein
MHAVLTRADKGRKLERARSRRKAKQLQTITGQFAVTPSPIVAISSFFFFSLRLIYHRTLKKHVSGQATRTSTEVLEFYSLPMICCTPSAFRRGKQKNCFEGTWVRRDSQFVFI